MKTQALVGDTMAVRRTFELLSVNIEDLEEDIDSETRRILDLSLSNAELYQR